MIVTALWRQADSFVLSLSRLWFHPRYIRPREGMS